MNIPVLRDHKKTNSYVKCPDCGKEIKVFGESHSRGSSSGDERSGCLAVCRLDMKLAEAVENEKFYEAENPYLADVKL